MKKSLFLPLFFLAAFCVSAQSSEKMSVLINTQKANLGQIAYLAAVYSGFVGENAGYEDALDSLVSKDIVSSDKKTSDEVSVADVSYIFAKSAGLKGGLFWRMIPSKRYAFKELQAKGVIPAEVDPDEKISGRDAVGILNDCISLVSEKE